MLELGVPRRSNLQKRSVAAVVESNAGDHLGMAAIEGFGEPHDRGKSPDDLAPLPWQRAKEVVPPPGHRPPVVARHHGDGLDFVGFEAAQVPILDQIVRVLVVTLVADMDADIMQQARVLEPFALAVREAMHAARLVEQQRCEPRHVMRVLPPVVAALGQLDDAAPPDVGVAIRLRDLGSVTRDVIKDQSLSQRQVAQRQVGRFEAPHDQIEQNGAGHGEIGSLGIESGEAKALGKVRAGDETPNTPDLLRGDAGVPERCTGTAAHGGAGDRTKAENGS